jgi:alpha-L-arabinofuranosidase
MNPSIIALRAAWLSTCVVAICNAAAPGAGSTVTIHTSTNLGQLTPISIGINAAAWDTSLVDASVPALLADANLGVLRYPGGSTSNNYHWLSNTPDDPNHGGTTEVANFDAFMGVVDASGAHAMITVNYGSGTAEEAAQWVAYANKGGHHYRGPVPTYPGASSRGHRYQIRYWEIGNELYGDGTYGASWELNYKSHDPTTYANGVVSYTAAMKAVDPSIQIGMVLTAPGNWPDGQTSASSPQPWNDTVLPIACGAVDFVSIHWYPQGPTGESDAALLASPQKGESTSVSYTPSIADMMTSLKAQLAQYCGKRAGKIEIMVTETNSVSYNPGKQTTSLVNALYLDDAVMTWLENGVANLDWWAIHNSPFDGNIDTSLYGGYAFGDYGVLSRGLTSSNGIIEPAAETPFPAYYGLQMLSYLGDAWDTMLKTDSSTELVSAHAVKQLDGRVNVMLINKDPVVTQAVNVSLGGSKARGIAQVFAYGKNETAVSRRKMPVRGGGFAITLEPYSVTTVKLP